MYGTTIKIIENNNSIRSVCRISTGLVVDVLIWIVVVVVGVVGLCSEDCCDSGRCKSARQTVCANYFEDIIIP